MEESYNRQLAVRQFKVLEGVGVRTGQGKKVNKNRSSFNLPAVIIQVVQEQALGKQARVPREMYRLLTQFGIISTFVKADDLTPLSINNFPLLKAAADAAAAKMESYRQQVLDDVDLPLPSSRPTQQQLAQEQRKLTGGLLRHRAAGPGDRMEDVGRTQGQAGASDARQSGSVWRDTATRAAKTAADTAIAASLALPAAAGTDQAVLRPVRTEPSRMVRIVRSTKTHYVVQWSQPEGNPAETMLDKKKLVMTVEEIALVGVWDSRHGPDFDPDIDLTSSE